MDCCCLNRPFDDQSDPIISLETEAIKSILELCYKGTFSLVTSDVLKFEIGKTPDIVKRERLKVLEGIAREQIKLSEHIINRAKHFEQLGIKPFDALHLACAESGADVFLTVDSKLLKKVKTIPDLKVEVYNPVDWIRKILSHEA